MSVPPDRNGSPQLPRLPNGSPAVIGGILGYLSTRRTNAMQIAEAQKNRDFQREMSDTALQRSTRDAILAGINPIFLAGRGASTPGGAQADIKDAGEGASRGVASALAVRQARANIDLTEAQALETRNRAYQAQTRFPTELEELAVRIHQGKLSATEKQNTMAFLIQKAEEEVRLTANSADRAAAAAELDRLRRTGEANLEKLEKRLGESSPALQLLLQLIKTMR